MRKSHRNLFFVTMLVAAVLGGMAGHEVRNAAIKLKDSMVSNAPVTNQATTSSAEYGEPGTVQVPLVDRLPGQAYTGKDPSFSELLGMANDSSYPTRLAALETIFARKSEGDFDLLYAFLEGAFSANDLTAENRLGLQKLIYEFLFTEEQNNERLKSHIMGVLADTQAAGSATEALLSSIERFFERPGNHADVIAQLWALNERAPSGSAVSALAALGRIEAGRPGVIDKQHLADTVSAALLAPSSTIEMRVLALKLGAWLKLATVKKAAQSLAQNSEHDNTVRITALSVVGTNGDHGDVDWLRELEQRSSYPINAAAGQIRKTLEQN